jgi:hypothetical protein
VSEVSSDAPSHAKLSELRSLLAKVEGASERLDTETLGRLLCAVAGKPFGGASLGCGDDGSDELSVWDADEETVETFARGSYRDLAPDRSLDAALALVDRVLPGWRASLLQHVPAWEAVVARNFAGRADKGPHEVRTAVAATPALALLAACLKALIAQEEERS